MALVKVFQKLLLLWDDPRLQWSVSAKSGLTKGTVDRAMGGQGSVMHMTQVVWTNRRATGAEIDETFSAGSKISAYKVYHCFL